MGRRKKIECKDLAWLNSSEKTEIDKLLMDIEKEEKRRRNSV